MQIPLQVICPAPQSDPLDEDELDDELDPEELDDEELDEPDDNVANIDVEKLEILF